MLFCIQFSETSDEEEKRLMVSCKALDFVIICEDTGDNLLEEVVRELKKDIAVKLMTNVPVKGCATYRDSGVLVDIDIDEIKKSIGTEAVRKTVSIPLWLDILSRDCDINLSQELQRALMERLGVFDKSKEQLMQLGVLTEKTIYTMKGAK